MAEEASATPEPKPDMPLPKVLIHQASESDKSEINAGLENQEEAAADHEEPPADSAAVENGSAPAKTPEPSPETGESSTRAEATGTPEAPASEETPPGTSESQQVQSTLVVPEVTVTESAPVDAEEPAKNEHDKSSAEAPQAHSTPPSFTENGDDSVDGEAKQVDKESIPADAQIQDEPVANIVPENPAEKGESVATADGTCQSDAVPIEEEIKTDKNTDNEQTETTEPKELSSNQVRVESPGEQKLSPPEGDSHVGENEDKTPQGATGEHEEKEPQNQGETTTEESPTRRSPTRDSETPETHSPATETAQNTAENDTTKQSLPTASSPVPQRSVTPETSPIAEAEKSTGKDTSDDAEVQSVVVEITTNSPDMEETTNDNAAVTTGTPSEDAGTSRDSPEIKKSVDENATGTAETLDDIGEEAKRSPIQSPSRSPKVVKFADASEEPPHSETPQPTPPKEEHEPGQEVTVETTPTEPSASESDSTTHKQAEDVQEPQQPTTSEDTDANDAGHNLTPKLTGAPFAMVLEEIEDSDDTLSQESQPREEEVQSSSKLSNATDVSEARTFVEHPVTPEGQSRDSSPTTSDVQESSVLDNEAAKQQMEIERLREQNQELTDDINRLKEEKEGLAEKLAEHELRLSRLAKDDKDNIQTIRIITEENKTLKEDVAKLQQNISLKEQQQQLNNGNSKIPGTQPNKKSSVCVIL